jgi:sporulation protein YlmC with PRC-barrel domain
MMNAAELHGGNTPSLNEALAWIGFRVDDIYGAGVGTVEDVWIDPGTGAPRWLLVKEGGFDERSTLVPFNDATAGAGHVWVPYERNVVREAPQIEPGVPLTQQVEATLGNHYAANAAAAVSHGSQPTGRTESHQQPGGTQATVRLASAQPMPPPPRSEPSSFVPPRLPDRPAPPVMSSATSYAQPSSAQQRPAAPVPPPPAPVPRFEYPPQPQPPADPRQQLPHAYQPPAGYQYQPLPPTPPDPVAMLAAIPPGTHIELELAGNLTISGELRQVRITPRDGGSEQPA